MKTDIILAGVGGQGILTIATAIGFASLHENLFVKQSEVHGMSQRGGAVLSHLRISDQPIFSDMIPSGKADLILSVEPMESLRYLTYLTPTAWLVTNSTPFINIPDYPDIEELKQAVFGFTNHLWIDADQVARDLGSIKYSNIVMLGAASPYIGINAASFRRGIEQVFKRKGDQVIDANLAAFDAGVSLSNKR